MRPKIILNVAAFILSGASLFADESPDSANPYESYYAVVTRVIDGDTIEVEVDLWPGLIATYAVRERGIDAPEIRRPGCEEERKHGIAAKRQLEKLYDSGTRVRLENVETDVWSGRIVADIRRYRSDRWLYLEAEMVERGLAHEWTPNMTDVPWCALLKED